MNDAKKIIGFEGAEKRLFIEFYGNDLRTITRACWDLILADARCTVIGFTSDTEVDSYVLSESSLFVFAHRCIIKTCGTTTLLGCLKSLLKFTSEIGAFPKLVQYSRCNFLFPEVQPQVHSSFEIETQVLGEYFEGNAYVLGPVNRSRWHLYVAHVAPPAHLAADEQRAAAALNDRLEERIHQQAKIHSHNRRYSINKRRPQQPQLADHMYDDTESEDEATLEQGVTKPTLEVCMFELDREAMATFYRQQKGPATAAATTAVASTATPLPPSASLSSTIGKEKEKETEKDRPCGAHTLDANGATTKSGIDQLLPEAHIDSHLFDPCGYSCNGFVPGTDVYFTIHITPEPHCSYVSFEVNVPLKSYAALVQKVLNVFRPGKFTLNVTSHDPLRPLDGADWSFVGFKRLGLTTSQFENDGHATCGTFSKNVPTVPVTTTTVPADVPCSSSVAASTTPATTLTTTDELKQQPSTEMTNEVKDDMVLRPSASTQSLSSLDSDSYLSPNEATDTENENENEGDSAADDSDGDDSSAEKSGDGVTFEDGEEGEEGGEGEVDATGRKKKRGKRKKRVNPNLKLRLKLKVNMVKTIKKQKGRKMKEREKKRVIFSAMKATGNLPVENTKVREVPKVTKVGKLLPVVNVNSSRSQSPPPSVSSPTASSGGAIVDFGAAPNGGGHAVGAGAAASAASGGSSSSGGSGKVASQYQTVSSVMAAARLSGAVLLSLSLVAVNNLLATSSQLISQ